MNDWVNRSMVVFSLAGLLVACIVASPVIAADGVVLPSDSGVVAYLEKVSSRFPRVDGLGDVGMSQWVSLAYDAASQRLLIADYHYDELLVVNEEGQVEAVLANSSTATVPAPWMMDCHDVAIDSGGRIYIADMRNATVWVVGSDLSWLGALSIPPDEEPGFPWSVAIDSRDRVIVGDYRSSGHSRVLVYEQGKEPGRLDLVASFRYNPPDEPAYCGVPFDVTVDSQDRIIIAESSTAFSTRERVHVFDKEFRWVTTFGSAGSGPGQFLYVTSLAIGPSDIIAVSDRALDRSTVSFFFRNGTYAGRITGLHHAIGLLYTRPAKLLVGDELVHGGGAIDEIDVDWETLHAGSELVTDAGMVPLLVLAWILSVRLTRRTTLLTSDQGGDSTLSILR